MIKDKNFSIYGYSEGDRSVGIWSCEFSINTGVLLDKQDKDNFNKQELSRNRLITSIRKAIKEYKPYQKKLSYMDWLHILTTEMMFELHDNGRLHIYDNLNGDEE